jgi:hypothetical protein
MNLDMELGFSPDGQWLGGGLVNKKLELIHISDGKRYPIVEGAWGKWQIPLPVFPATPVP